MRSIGYPDVMGLIMVLYRLHERTAELCCVHVPEIPAQYFADWSLRDFINELNMFGPFVISERSLAVGDHLFDSHIGIR